MKGSDGGDGGHTGGLVGKPGQAPAGGDLYGGGGGGGVGRIAVKTRSGAATTTGAALSPTFGENSPGRAAPATLGPARFH